MVFYRLPAPIACVVFRQRALMKLLSDSRLVRLVLGD